MRYIRYHLKRRRTTVRGNEPLDLSSLESDLWLHFERNEYMSSLFVSPSMQTLGTFLVTDGSKVINWGITEMSLLQLDPEFEPDVA